MNQFFKATIVLQLIVEFGVGVSMVLFPHAAVPAAAQSEIFLLMNQGFIALAMGIVTALLWAQRKNSGVVSFGVALFAIYHSLITLSGAVTAAMGNTFTPFLVHLVLAAMFWVLWFGRHRLGGQAGI